MEASGAGLAAAPAEAAPSGDQADQQRQAAEPTLADIHGSLQQFGSDIEQMREHLASEPWKPAEQATEPAEPENMDFGFLDENAPTYQGPEQAAQQLQDLIRNEATKIAKETLQPVQQEIQQERQDRQLTELGDRYPQLQDEKVAGELLDLTAKFVEKEGMPKELAFHPGMMETLYLAARAREQNSDTGGDAAAATLEGAGGASPGGAGQGADQTARPWGEQVAPKRLPLFSGG